RVPTWYSAWAPEWTRLLLRRITADHISQDELVRLLNEALAVPGLANAWTMPVKGRLDMLTTGLRTPVGLKISGADPAMIEVRGEWVESVLRGVTGTRSVFAERARGGYFVDVDWNRQQLGRHGLSLDDAQRVIESAIGGDNITTAVAGRARYPVSVRYLPEFRGDICALERVLVSTNGQRQIPLGQLATIRATTGPSMLRDENGLLTGYVYVDIGGRSASAYVEEARRVVEARVVLPAGYAISWSGQYEAMARARERLTAIVPVTLLLIVLLLYISTRSMTKTLIVLLAVPFSAIGAVWLLYGLGYNVSVAVWGGLIALLGVDAGTGAVKRAHAGP